MILTKDLVNKLTNIVDDSLIILKNEEFSEGDVLILFNNSELTATIQSDVSNTYQSGFAKKRNTIEFPPRCLMNAVFVDNNTVVFAKGV